MATISKDFKLKHGLIVEGTNATVGNYDVLTKKPDDQNYIIGLIGGSATPLATPDTVVLRDENADFSAGTITANLVGNVTGTVSDISNHTTDSLSEGLSNKYFSDFLAQQAIANNLGTGIVYSSENAGNVFHIDENVVATTTTNQTLQNKNISGIDNNLSNIANSSLVNDSITINNYNTALGSSVTLNTDDVSDTTSTNKYFTDTLARGAVGAGDGINYNSSTGVFSAHLGNGLQIDLSGAVTIDDSVVATDSDITSAISTHNASSGVHGVNGDIVGTTDTQVLSNKSLGSDLDADGYKITNVGTPQNGGDAATKAYVDGTAAGLTWKQAVNLLSTTNIDLSADLTGTVIDGHAALGPTHVGYRLLLSGQTNSAENGIYEIVAQTGLLVAVRPADADAYTELVGAAVFVMEGTSYESTSWVQTDHYITDFSGQDWVQFSGSGTYVAGNGLDLNGNEFSINTTVTATVSHVSTEIGNHASDTSTHGVTGSIVGTTDSQTLTNKTLGSSTILGANLDAANYHITNLDDPTSNQDAATKFYVDGEVSTVAGDLTTHAGLTTGTHGITGTIVGTSDSQTLTNKIIDGSSNTVSNIANTSLVNDSITINGNATALGSSVILDTDDVSEGTTNKYFTDNRAKDAAGYILENSTQTNISITYDEINHQLTVTAEDGFAGHSTTDLPEGTNLYFTDARAVDALEAVVPNFTEIDINSVATQVAAKTSVATASTVTAYQFAHADYRSAKFLVKAQTSTHTELSEVLVTLDSLNNIAITEYAEIGTNGNLFNVTADVDGVNARLRVTTVNNSTDVTVVGTLVA